MDIVQAYRHPYNLLVPACLSTQMDIYARIKYSLKEEMSKSVGYSVVGLAAVLLGVLIVVPFVKGFFVSQFDGYIDYSATFLTYAMEKAVLLNSYIMTVNIAKLTTLQTSYQSILSSTPVTDPSYGDKQNQLMLVTLAINAMKGDANSKIIVQKITGPITAADAALYGSTVPTTAPVKTAVTVGAAPVGAGQAAVPTTAAAAAPVKTAVTVGAAPVGAGQVAVPATAATASPSATAAMIPNTTVGQVAGVAPSLSVNVAKPSSTLDLLKSACQSLIADTTVSLTGVAPVTVKPLV